MGGEELLSTGEQAHIATGALAEEALKLWSEGVEFEEMMDNAHFTGALMFVLSPELAEAVDSEVKKDPVLSGIEAELREKIKKEEETLVDQGHTRDEAEKIVAGNVLKSLINLRSMLEVD